MRLQINQCRQIAQLTSISVDVAIPPAGYWNAGGQQNVESMLTFLTEEYLKQSGAPPPAVVETPATGALHASHLTDLGFVSSIAADRLQFATAELPVEN